MKLKFTIFAFLTLLLFAGGLFFGSVSIPWSEVLGILTGSVGDEATRFIVLQSRLPQSVTALLGGAALAVTGLMLQTAFRNPLAGPSILGISSGASLGVALVMLFFGGTLTLGTLTAAGNSAVIIGAFLGSLAVMGVLTAISLRVRNNLMLLIAGIMVGYLTSSLVTLLSSMATSQGVQSYVMWGMGTFSGVNTHQLPFFSISTAIGLLLALLLAKPLNILMLGDGYARNLGVNVDRVRIYLLLITGLLTAVVTAYCGPVAFIGLSVPHIARMIWRTDNHWILFPATMLCGAIVALGCCLLSVIPDSNVIPINALTPIVGVPVVLYVILTKR